MTDTDIAALPTDTIDAIYGTLSRPVHRDLTAAEIAFCGQITDEYRRRHGLRPVRGHRPNQTRQGLIDALTARRNTTIPAPDSLVASVYWQNRRTRGGGAWVLTVKDGHHAITRDLPGDTTQTADAIDAALALLRPAAV